MPSIVSTAFAPPVGPAKLRLVLLLVIAGAPGTPVFWLTRASRDPLASVTTLALTPRFWPLMYLASVVSVSLLPFVMVMACVAPVAPPICKSISPVVAPVGKIDALAPPAKSFVYTVPALARLVTTMEWFPGSAVVCAVAVRTPLFEDVAAWAVIAPKGSERAVIAVARLVRSLLMLFSAVACD